MRRTLHKREAETRRVLWSARTAESGYGAPGRPRKARRFNLPHNRGGSHLHPPVGGSLSCMISSRRTVRSWVRSDFLPGSAFPSSVATRSGGCAEASSTSPTWFASASCRNRCEANWARGFHGSCGVAGENTLQWMNGTSLSRPASFQSTLSPTAPLHNEDELGTISSQPSIDDLEPWNVGYSGAARRRPSLPLLEKLQMMGTNTFAHHAPGDEDWRPWVVGNDRGGGHCRNGREELGGSGQRPGGRSGSRT